MFTNYKALISFRRLFALMAFLTALVLMGAYFLEYRLSLQPCPLCLLQRYVLWIVAILLIVGAIHNPKHLGRFYYGAGVILASLIGVLLAGRQIWIQFLPPQEHASCVANLNRLFQYLSWPQFIEAVFMASGECGRGEFTLFGLSLAAWSCLLFLGLILGSVSILVYQKKRRII